MKILFCGGGSGGHFYPIISIAEAVNTSSREQHLLPPELHYMAPTPYDERSLFSNNITYHYNSAGKWRRYFSLLNIRDLFKVPWSIFTAFFRVYKIYPDVVVGKGGYASFPVLVSAYILGIPIIIHESDSKPGRVNKLAGKFAHRIAVSYPEATKFFPENKVAYTGQPIRTEILDIPKPEVGASYFKLDPNIKTILILGGSQGSKKINETILEIIDDLVSEYQIIHQAGSNNITETQTTANFLLGNNKFKDRYKIFSSLNSEELRNAVSISSLIISRAGSTAFEIAAWKKPSIMIPLPESISHDQTANAYAYARSGSASVIAQENLTGNLLHAEINRIINTPEVYNAMVLATESVARLDASKLIAQEILNIGMAHE